MTLSELRDDLRLDKLAELSTDTFSDDALLDFLIQSHDELGARFGVPRVEDESVTAALTSRGAPVVLVATDVLNCRADGRELRRAPLAELGVWGTLAGNPRVFAFDKAADTLYVAPASLGLTLSYTYVQRYSGLTTTSDAWGGFYPEWHDLISQHAASKAFASTYEYDKAQVWQERFEKNAAEFSAYLGDQV